MSSTRLRHNSALRRFTSLAKVVVSLGLLWWVAGTLDVGRVMDLAGRLDVHILFLALALVVLQTVIMGWRWHRVVELLGGGLPPNSAIQWAFVGLFFNQALPGSVGGDLFRMWKLKHLGVEANFAFASVAIERLTGIALLALLVTLCVPSIWRQTGDITILLILLALGPAFGMGLWVVSCWHEKLARYLPSALSKLIGAFGTGMTSLIHRPFSMAEVMGLGVAASLTGILSAYVIALHVGMLVSFPAFVTLLGAAILLSVLPLSAGGWGVREASAVMIFGAAGIAPEQALAVSIAYGLLPLVISLPIGLAFWIFGTSSHRRGSPPSDADPFRSEG